jgi:hypothetical protein
MFIRRGGRRSAISRRSGRAHGARRGLFLPAIEALEPRAMLTNSSLVFPGADGHLVYVPNAQGGVIPNFSMVGYQTGDVPLPDTPGGVTVPVKATVNPAAAGVDMTQTIQNAINTVSALPLGANGFRGAVLLTAGNYPISSSLSISASGVVLEGQGNNATTGTRLEATGTSLRFLISIAGSGSKSTVSGTTHNITNSYVPVGATSFTVDSTANLHVGDTVIVNRPSTQAWITAIGMDQLTNPWTPGSKDLNSDRVITAINGNTITIDAPLTNSLDQQYGGGTIYRYTWTGRISNVGLENLYTYSDSVGADDANHATGMLTMDTVQNAWVNNVTGSNYELNVVEIGSGAKWVTFNNDTIENTSDTATNITDAPAGIGNSGQEVLIENTTFLNAFHAIAIGSSVPGPNVYYNLNITNPAVDPLVSSHSREEAGPHQRWSTGGLFDNVTSSDWLNIRNAGNEGSGHGWQGANYVLWNVNARTDVSSPPTAQNWVIGGTASTSEGTGDYDQRGKTVTPQSLYVAQLLDRLTPTVATAAAVSPGTVTGKTATLTALGADAAGESSLIYTWLATTVPAGAAAPTFSSANGTNAGKSTIVTFSKAGAYAFRVTIQYSGGFSVTSSVNVTVGQALTSVLVSPTSINIANGATKLFNAEALDQFGAPVSPQPAFVWSVGGSGAGGTIDAATGLYTAPTGIVGSDSVKAASATVSGSATVNVIPGVAGDFNLDGRLTADDVPAMIAALTDLNAYQASRNLTAAELTMVGDLDGDGAVTNADLQQLLENLRAESEQPQNQQVTPQNKAILALRPTTTKGRFMPRYDTLLAYMRPVKWK